MSRITNQTWYVCGVVLPTDLISVGVQRWNVPLLSENVVTQQKYFDSGDYNMAKAKIKNKQLPTAAPEKTEITGDHIPTPQDLPQRKPSLVASKLAGWSLRSAPRPSPCPLSVTSPLPTLTVPPAPSTPPSKRNPHQHPTNWFADPFNSCLFLGSVSAASCPVEYPATPQTPCYSVVVLWFLFLSRSFYSYIRFTERHPSVSVLEPRPDEWTTDDTLLMVDERRQAAEVVLCGQRALLWGSGCLSLDVCI